MAKSDIFDLLGACLVTLFAFVVWPPLALLAFGGFCFLAARAAEPQSGAAE